MIQRQACRSIGRILALAVMVGGTVTPVFAAGDAASGLKLARQWCASCHAVESSAVMSDIAPPFSAMAERRDKAWIKAWLSDPHPPMTGIELSHAQIDDVMAYLTSLPKN